MREKYDALDDRTKRFAVRVIQFARELDSVPVVRWLVRQFVDAATSVAANQRAARRARSTKELAAKLSIIVEEADECAFWSELFQDLSLPASLSPELASIAQEATELRAVFAKGRSTVRQRLARERHGKE